MTYLTSITRYKTTCLRNPGITHVTSKRPDNQCPICFKPLHVNSCAVIREMSSEAPPKIYKKVGPNMRGSSEPRAKSLANARMDLQARARRPNLRIN